MQNIPYWIMIGAVAGFFLGILVIMMAMADFSVDHVLSQPGDAASLPPMQLRILIIVLCMAFGMISGLLATLILLKVGPDVELPVL